MIPYADLHSSDAEELNNFCLAVDGLLPRLAKLRQMQGTAGQWVAEIEALIRDFLDIPDDRPEESSGPRSAALGHAAVAAVRSI